MNVILDVNRHANDLWIGRASVLYSSDYAVLAVRFSIIPPWRHKPIGLQLALNLGAALWSKQCLLTAATVIEMGSGKPVGLQGTSERARAIWTRSAHLHAGQRQLSMRRVTRPTTRKDFTRRPELDKEKPRVAGAGGASTHEGPAC